MISSYHRRITKLSEEEVAICDGNDSKTLHTFMGGWDSERESMLGDVGKVDRKI